MAKVPPRCVPIGTQVTLVGYGFKFENRECEVLGFMDNDKGGSNVIVKIDGKKYPVPPTQILPTGCVALDMDVVIQGLESANFKKFNDTHANVRSYKVAKNPDGGNIICMDVVTADGGSVALKPKNVKERFPANCEVEIFGLKSRSDLNGLKVSVVGINASKGAPNTIIVMLPENKKQPVKPANLREPTPEGLSPVGTELEIQGLERLATLNGTMCKVVGFRSAADIMCYRVKLATGESQVLKPKNVKIPGAVDAGAEAKETERKAEEERKAAELEAQRKTQEAEAQRAAEAETQRIANEAEAQRKAEQEVAQKKAEEEARKAAEEEAQRKAEAETVSQRKAAEEAEAQQKAAAEAEAQRKAAEEAEAQRKAAEEAEAQQKAAAEAEAQRKAAEEAETQRKATDEAEAQRKIAEEVEAQRKAAEDAETQRRIAEQKAAEEAAKQKVEEETAQKKAAEDAQEVERKKAEAEKEKEAQRKKEEEAEAERERLAAEAKAEREKRIQELDEKEQQLKQQLKEQLEKDAGQETISSRITRVGIGSLVNIPTTQSVNHSPKTTPETVPKQAPGVSVTPAGQALPPPQIIAEPFPKEQTPAASTRTTPAASAHHTPSEPSLSTEPQSRSRSNTLNKSLSITPSMNLGQLTPNTLSLTPEVDPNDTWVRRLDAVYSKHMPKKKDTMKVLLQRYDGREEALFDLLVKKYKDTGIVNYREPGESDGIQQVGLEVHTRLRGMYDADPLKFDVKCAGDAIRHAASCISNGNVSRDGSRVGGQNIWMDQALGETEETILARALEEWHKEYALLVAEPHKAAHCGQMLWRAVKQMGVGVCVKGGLACVVVNYGPSGKGEYDLDPTPFRINLKLPELKQPETSQEEHKNSDSTENDNNTKAESKRPGGKKRLAPLTLDPPKTVTVQSPKLRPKPKPKPKPTPQPAKEAPPPMSPLRLPPSIEIPFTDPDGDLIKFVQLVDGSVALQINRQTPQPVRCVRMSKGGPAEFLLTIPALKTAVMAPRSIMPQLSKLFSNTGVEHNLPIEAPSSPRTAKTSFNNEEVPKVRFMDDADVVTLKHDYSEVPGSPMSPGKTRAPACVLEVGKQSGVRVSVIKLVESDVGVGLYFPEYKKAVDVPGMREVWEIWELLDGLKVKHDLPNPPKISGMHAVVAAGIALAMITSERDRELKDEKVFEVMKYTGSPERRAKVYLAHHNHDVSAAISALQGPVPDISPAPIKRQQKKPPRPVTNHKLFNRGWHLQFYRGDIALRGIGFIHEVHLRLEREVSTAFNVTALGMTLLGGDTQRVAAALFPEMGTPTGLGEEEAIMLGMDPNVRKTFLVSFGLALRAIGLEVDLKTGEFWRPRQHHDAGWSRPATSDRFRVLGTKEGAPLRKVVTKMIHALCVFNYRNLAHSMVAFFVNAATEPPNHLMGCKEACVKWVSVLNTYMASTPELLNLLSSNLNPPWRVTNLSSQVPLLKGLGNVQSSPVAPPRLKLSVKPVPTPETAGVLTPMHHRQHEMPVQTQEGTVEDAMLQWLAAVARPVEDSSFMSRGGALPAVRIEEDTRSFRVIIKSRIAVTKVKPIGSGLIVTTVGDPVPGLGVTERVLADEVCTVSGGELMMSEATRTLELPDKIMVGSLQKEEYNGYTVVSVVKVVEGGRTTRMGMEEESTEGGMMSPRRPAPNLRIVEGEDSLMLYIRGGTECMSYVPDVMSLVIMQQGCLLPPFTDPSTILLLDELSKPYTPTSRLPAAAHELLSPMLSKTPQPRYLPSSTRTLPLTQPIMPSEMTITPYGAGHTLVRLPILPKDAKFEV